jgi:hypothetical protein
MKLSTQTIGVLKNFGAINEGIYFKKGKILKTISRNKNILAEATIAEDIPSDFGVEDLNNFLSVIGMHNDDPVFEFDGTNVIINGNKGRSKQKYRYCQPSMIVMPPEKALTLPDPEITFDLSAEDFSWVMKSSQVLGTPNVVIESDGSTINIVSSDLKNNSSHTDALEVGKGNGDKYKMVFLTEHLSKVLSGSYTVQISSKGLAQFQNKNVALKYWVATETGSTFTKG